ncbi:MAG: T3SS effector HopA1 family protein [Desulfobacterales bacterium]|nr:T3SS effector HopA1 family protein [Desulfobacterales bacterium]
MERSRANAATKIQRAFRQYKQERRTKNESATKIQTAFKQFRQRKQEARRIKNESANKIQKVFKEFKQRKQETRIKNESAAKIQRAFKRATQSKQPENDGSWESLKSWAHAVRKIPAADAFKARGWWGKRRKRKGNPDRTQGTLNKRVVARDVIYAHYAKKTGGVGQASLTPDEKKEQVRGLQTFLTDQERQGQLKTEVHDQYGKLKRVKWPKGGVESEDILARRADDGGFTYQQTTVAGRGQDTSGGRLTVVAEKTEYTQLGKNIHNVIGADKATDGKVTVPGDIHNRADAAVLYLKGNKSTARDKARIAADLTKNVRTIDKAPGGMGRVAHGVFTSETPQYAVKKQDPSAHQQSSHGAARSMIIEKAIRSTTKNFGKNASDEQFETVLKYKLARHGLDPEQPSTRKAGVNLPKPWVK